MVIFVFLFVGAIFHYLWEDESEEDEMDTSDDEEYLFGDENIGDRLDHGVGEEVGEPRVREEGEGQIGAGVATVLG